jgi:choline dehydrogenase
MEAFGDIKGVEFPPDSGAGMPGVYWYPTSTDPNSMTRSLSRTGHFDGISRDNYEAITGQKVLNVIFDQDKKATGVRYVAAKAKNDTDAHVVRARKEIIMAAGTIHTPHILQGSGIGAKSLLEEAGIDVVVDLPGVGWNLQDHPLGGGASFDRKGEMHKLTSWHN